MPKEINTLDSFIYYMKIVKARKEDLDGFIELEKEFKKYNKSLNIDTHYEARSSAKLTKLYFKKDFLKRLKQKNLFFYFAKRGEEYVGYVYGYLITLPKGFDLKKLGYLDGIIVKKKYRGKRIASKLKQEFFKWLRKRDVNVCQIHVASRNKRTLAIYQKWGFKIDEHRLYKKI